MLMKIEDAPFTDEQKKEIISLGIVNADWGHPDIVLDDPVKYFKDMQKKTAKLFGKGGAGITHYEADKNDNPMGG